MFLHRISALLRFVGCFLATCVKLPSAVRNNGRRALALLIVLGIFVCTPVFAVNDQYTDGFIYWENGASVIISDGVKSVDLLQGYFPASISANSDDSINSSYRNFIITGSNVSVNPNTSPTWSAPFMYVEVLFSVPAPLTVSVSGISSSYSASLQGILQLVGINPDGGYYNDGNSMFANRIDCVYDSLYVETAGTSPNFSVTSGSYDIKHYFGYRYYFDSFSETKSLKLSEWALRLRSNFNGKYAFSDPNYPEAIFNEVTVNTGVLKEINGTLKEILTSTTQIKSDVSNIKDTVTDTNNQLQNPESNIWRAAGSAISDAVTGLFVPDQAQLDAKMKEVENIVINKMGDTYEVIQKSQVYEDQFVAGFTGSGSEYAFHFPGLSVPLPDGIVSILPEQDVHLQNKAFNVFRNMLGTLVAVLCGFSAVHLGHDFIICIFSGISYWGFLRSRHDR